ncbi:hypothetical protein FA15DRAFT_666511 [Coprinopsis marcescibilis]|uniref:Uncharacterized protein n=1 Tax=Coprinopsis marcescibilis TaxID=230819 RepID=A0A5C3L316_COPMA|nr:hypothetical protein FA15DRAFT_666511 [Coprinopsis marcescibilis]
MIIDQLPFEIMGEIFSQYIHLKDTDPTNNYKAAPRSGITASSSACTTPWTLGQVCSKWRTIVLSIPTLWSTIGIVCPSQGELRVLHVWIQRSKQAKLDLELKCCCQLDDPMSDSNYNLDAKKCSRLEAAMKYLLLHVARWKRVEFEVSDTTSGAFKDLAVENASALETVAIHNVYMFPSKVLKQLYSKIYSLPQLRRVQFPGKKAIGNTIVPSPANYTKLTELSFHALYSRHVHGFLKSCSATLRKFEVSRIIVTTPIVLAKSPPLCMPSLQHFKVANCMYYDPDTVDQSLLLINNLTLPAIVSLEFSVGDFEGSRDEKLGVGFDTRTGTMCCNGSDPAWRTLQKLLGSSTFRPKRLLFSSEGIANDLALAIIRSPLMVDLEHLHVAALVSNPFLLALRVEEDGEAGEKVLLPHLQSLVITRCHSANATLSSVIISRAASLKSAAPHFQGKLRSAAAILCGPGPFDIDLKLNISGMVLDIKQL